MAIRSGRTRRSPGLAGREIERILRGGTHSLQMCHKLLTGADFLGAVNDDNRVACGRERMALIVGCQRWIAPVGDRAAEDTAIALPRKRKAGAAALRCGTDDVQFAATLEVGVEGYGDACFHH